MNKPTVLIEPRGLREPTLRTIGCVQCSDAAGEGLEALFEKSLGNQARVRSS